ncbi:MAG: ABC-2 transporter permease [Sporolactobacillus sp.]
MIQLMGKDLLTQKRTTWLGAVLLLAFIIVMNNDHAMVQTLYCMATAFIAYILSFDSNFGTEETERTANFLVLSLPVSRRQVILAKYIMIAIWWAVALLVCLLLSLVKGIIHEGAIAEWLISGQTIALSLILTILLTSLLYPIFYRFGYKTARMVTLFLFFGLSFGIGGLIGFLGSSPWLVFLLHHLIVIGAIASAAVLVVSYLFSLYFYKTKGF